MPEPILGKKPKPLMPMSEHGLAEDEERLAVGRVGEMLGDGHGDLKNGETRKP
jgi:hypothetical protein